MPFAVGLKEVITVLQEQQPGNCQEKKGIILCFKKNYLNLNTTIIELISLESVFQSEDSTQCQQTLPLLLPWSHLQEVEKELEILGV